VRHCIGICEALFIGICETLCIGICETLCITHIIIISYEMPLPSLSLCYYSTFLSNVTTESV